MSKTMQGATQSVERFGRWTRRWIAIPQPTNAARLTLIALALALQNLLELPREPITRLLGAGLTGILVVIVLGVSLVFLLVSVAPKAPGWRWPYRRRFQALALVVTLVVVPLGIVQSAKIVAASFSAPRYSNDGTTLDHYAAQQLLEGHNPYTTSNIVAAVRFLNQDPANTTPLRQGALANRPATQYPSPDELRSLFAERQDTPSKAVEFESQLSYPALSFLPLVPFVWAGLPSVVLFFALCLLALAVIMLRSVPVALRPWLGVLLLADTPLLNATLIGDLDVFYILLLFVAWRWWRRPIISTVAFGLALAAKQLAWFFAPFYLLLIWRRYGLRAALLRLAGGAAIFVALNAPFALNDPSGWLQGILAPQIDPMFPLGNGLIRISLARVLPLAPSIVYLALEVLAVVGCIVLYWRLKRTARGAAFALAVMPLWFAWRSLTTYFYFVTLPAFALTLADEAEDATPQRGGADVFEGIDVSIGSPAPGIAHDE